MGRPRNVWNDNSRAESLLIRRAGCLCPLYRSLGLGKGTVQIHEGHCRLRWIPPAIQRREPIPVPDPAPDNRLGLRIGAFRDSAS